MTTVDFWDTSASWLMSFKKVLAISKSPLTSFNCLTHGAAQRSRLVCCKLNKLQRFEVISLPHVLKINSNLVITNQKKKLERWWKKFVRRKKRCSCVVYPSCWFKGTRKYVFLLVLLQSGGSEAEVTPLLVCIMGSYFGKTVNVRNVLILRVSQAWTIRMMFSNLKDNFRTWESLFVINIMKYKTKHYTTNSCVSDVVSLNAHQKELLLYVSSSLHWSTLLSHYWRVEPDDVVSVLSTEWLCWPRCQRPINITFCFKGAQNIPILRFFYQI